MATDSTAPGIIGLRPHQLTTLIGTVGDASRAVASMTCSSSHSEALCRRFGAHLVCGARDARGESLAWGGRLADRALAGVSP